MPRLSEENRNKLIQVLQQCTEGADDEANREMQTLISFYGPTGHYAVQKSVSVAKSSPKPKRKKTKRRGIGTPGLRIKCRKWFEQHGWNEDPIWNDIPVLHDALKAAGVHMPRDPEEAMAEIRAILIKNSNTFVESDGKWNVRSNLKRNGKPPKPTPEK